MKQIFTNKWIILCLFLLVLMFYLQQTLPDTYEPTLIETLTDRSRYYIRELLGQNNQMYSVMLDEVRSDLNTFYLIIGLGIAVLIIITIQIIATITNLPVGYLAYPGKFLVVKKNNQAHPQLTHTDKGELK